jgi:hypothetical protein
MATTGQTASSHCKVYVEPDLALAWTAAGSVYVIEEVGVTISSMATQDPVRVFCREPNHPLIRSSFGGAVTQKLRQCYASALPFGIQQQVNNAVHPFISDFLLLGWAQATPWFLEISHDGQMNWHTKARFAAVGSGGPFASVAQALMEHYLEGPSVTVEDGLLLTYRTIATTCAVSPGGVGLPVWLAVVTDKGARILERAEVEQVGTSVDGWKLVEKDAFLSLRAKPSTPPETVDLPKLEETAFRESGLQAQEPSSGA